MAATTNTQFADVRIADALKIPVSAINTTPEEWFPTPNGRTVRVGGAAYDCHFDQSGLELILNARNGDLVWRRLQEETTNV
jgi:hypothetical protein